MTRPPDPLVQALADRRAELGISLSEVAYRRGLARYPGHLVRVENGELSPTLAVLRSWADALGCDLALVPRGDGGPDTPQACATRRQVLMQMNDEEENE